MPLSGRCLSVGTHVWIEGALNVSPTQKDDPLLSSKMKLNLQTHKWNENEWKENKWVPEATNDYASDTSCKILRWTGLE